jgi:3-dehydroquinate dehydratase-2
MSVKNKKIIVINGPNLNLLGHRETNIYGMNDLKTIEKALTKLAQKHKLDIECFQSNHEGEIIDFIHKNTNCDGILINPGALTHTSIALRDALTALGTKYLVEIHISNIFKREEFRHKSFISEIANGGIWGCGENGYYMGLQQLASWLNKT